MIVSLSTLGANQIVGVFGGTIWLVGPLFPFGGASNDQRMSREHSALLSCQVHHDIALHLSAERETERDTDTDTDKECKRCRSGERAARGESQQLYRYLCFLPM